VGVVGVKKGISEKRVGGDVQKSQHHDVVLYYPLIISRIHPHLVLPNTKNMTKYDPKRKNRVGVTDSFHSHRYPTKRYENG